jgi:hypothetical protein
MIVSSGTAFCLVIAIEIKRLSEKDSRFFREIRLNHFLIRNAFNS